MFESEVTELLRVRYARPAWAFIAGVRDATGSLQRRTADGVAFGCYPSRGLEIHGFEIKTDRRDWQRELANPAKAESVFRYCDRWWLVVSDETIVKDGELPSTWGLLVVRGGKLHATKPAPNLEAQPQSRPFIASVMRALHEQIAIEMRGSAKAKELEAACARAADAARKETARSHQDLAAKYSELRRAVQDFQEASGVTLSNWRAGKIGDAVAAMLRGDGMLSGYQLETAERHLSEALKSVRAVRQALGQGNAA